MVGEGFGLFGLNEQQPQHDPLQRRRLVLECRGSCSRDVRHRWLPRARNPEEGATLGELDETLNSDNPTTHR